MVFNNHSLPKRCGGSLTQSQSITRLSLSTEPTQMLHYCPGYSQAQLIRLIVSIYNGVPEAFEVLHCHPSSTEEEVGLFMERVAKHPLQYLVLEINRLPFKLQEVCVYLAVLIKTTFYTPPDFVDMTVTALLLCFFLTPYLLPVYDAATSGDPEDGGEDYLQVPLPAFC